MGLATKLTSNKITLAQWQISMREVVKTTHIQLYLVGKGGPALMTKIDYGKLGASLKKEYKFLDAFARDVRDGKLSPAGISLRCSMYGSASLLADYELGRFYAQKDAGKKEKRRLTSGDSHVCETCRSEAAQGWVPIDKPGWILGQTACRMGDRCGFEYR